MNTTPKFLPRIEQLVHNNEEWKTRGYTTADDYTLVKYLSLEEHEHKMAAVREKLGKAKYSLETISVAEVQHVIRNEYPAFMIDQGYINEAKKALAILHEVLAMGEK